MSGFTPLYFLIVYSRIQVQIFLFLTYYTSIPAHDMHHLCACRSPFTVMLHSLHDLLYYLSYLLSFIVLMQLISYILSLH